MVEIRDQVRQGNSGGRSMTDDRHTFVIREIDSLEDFLQFEFSLLDPEVQAKMVCFLFLLTIHCWKTCKKYSEQKSDFINIFLKEFSDLKGIGKIQSKIYDDLNNLIASLSIYMYLVLESSDEDR